MSAKGKNKKPPEGRLFILTGLILFLLRGDLCSDLKGIHDKGVAQTGTVINTELGTVDLKCCFIGDKVVRLAKQSGCQGDRLRLPDNKYLTGQLLMFGIDRF